jgi:predicted RNase H-like HicB family nuclease
MKNIREFTAVYQKRGRWFIAWIEEIPGVNTQGKTLKEAKENLKEALQLILETNRSIAIGKSINIHRVPLRIAFPASA